MIEREATRGLIRIEAPSSPDVKVDFKMIKALTAEEYARYAAAVTAVERVLRGDLIAYVRFADQQVQSLPTTIADQMLSVGVREFFARAPALQTLVRCTSLTYCAALHLHQEQTRSQIEKRFGGKDSVEAKRLADAFRAEATHSLEYSVAYQLRNIMVHQSMDLVGFKSRAELVERNGVEESVATVDLKISRAMFIASSRVSRRLRDLVAGEDLELTRIVTGATASADRVQTSALDLLHPNLEEDLRVIAELDSEYPPDDVLIPRALAQPQRQLEDGRWTWPHREIAPAVFDMARGRNECRSHL
jgi:hypothetical protein